MARGITFDRLLVASLLLISTGCSTYSHRVTSIRDAFYQNDLTLARQLIDRRLTRNDREADVLRLELAMVSLAEGQADEAERLMRRVRDRFDHLCEPDAGETTLSYLTDDQRRAYAGEDYEQILVRGMLALSNLLADGGDAEAYSLQTITKQEQIIQLAGEGTENLKRDYPRVALAPYLRGVLREATHRDYDDAGHAYATVVNWQPSFAGAASDMQRALHGHHSAQGNGVLYVFSLTGRGPYKEESVEAPTSAALLVAGEIFSALAEQTLPPNIAPVKVPRIVARPNRIQAIAVSIDDRPVGETATITDVTELALQQQDAVFNHLVARAVVRRLLKKGVLYGAKEYSDVAKGSAVSLAVDLAGVAWEASESADTRCWGLLPDKIQVLRVELPAGDHQLVLTPIGPGATPSEHAVRQSVSISDGRNTYVCGVFPDQRLVGQLSVSQY